MRPTGWIIAMLDSPSVGHVIVGIEYKTWSATVLETNGCMEHEAKFFWGDGATPEQRLSTAAWRMIELPTWSLARQSHVAGVNSVLSETAIGFPWRYATRTRLWILNGMGYHAIPPGHQSTDDGWKILWGRLAVSLAVTAAAFCSPWLFASGARCARGAYWKRHGKCPSCGYDLRSLPPLITTCPECGNSHRIVAGDTTTPSTPASTD